MKKIEDEVNSIDGVRKILYKQVELLAEASKECEPADLIRMTECISSVYCHIVYGR